MTGEILQRLREAYGLERKDLAEALGSKSCVAVMMLERCGRSWSPDRRREVRLKHGEKRQARFVQYLDALRMLRGKRARKRRVVFCTPPGATHQVERKGVKEWARIVPMHGTLRGFAWVCGEWIRAEWVEASNEFQVALLAARLPLKKRKTVPVQDATNTYHDILGERWRWRW